MQCRNDHQLKSKFAVKMKSYFIWFTCAVNFVTLFSVIAQLTIDHRGMAMEIEEKIKDDSNQESKVSSMIDHIEETVLVSGEIELNKRKRYVLDIEEVPREIVQREVGVREGRPLDMICQLHDGSKWSMCTWKHGSDSLSITRSIYGNGNDLTSNGYDPYGEVSISGGFTDCSLRIANVSRKDHSGKWTCYLSKNDLGKEATNYDVKIFTPAELKVSIKTSVPDKMKKDKKIENMFIMDSSSQIQCKGIGGYPEITNMSASILERNDKCTYTNEANECFFVVEELQGYVEQNHNAHGKLRNIILSVHYAPSIDDIRRNRVLVCYSNQIWESSRNEREYDEKIFERSLEMELNGNILHPPLPHEDPKWNGSAFVISKDNSHAPIFNDDGTKDYFVPLRILSNTAPIVYKASLIGIPLESSLETKEKEIISNLTYYFGTNNPNMVTIARPLQELYNLSKAYDLILEVHNQVGIGRFPLILDSMKIVPNNEIKNEKMILWILLPCAVGIVLLALAVLIFKACSNKWWCFEHRDKCQVQGHYREGLIAHDNDSHENDDSARSSKIYRTPVPPPPSFESRTSNINEIDEDNPLYEEIKYKVPKSSSSQNDGYINMRRDELPPLTPTEPTKENTTLILSNANYKPEGPCAVNSPVDAHFVNNIPCLSDDDGYLISNSIKVKDITTVELNTANQKQNDENQYDHLEFNRPVKKLEPHYQSSKTLKSIASMENVIKSEILI